MNYDIKCSKYPPLADILTHMSAVAGGSLSQSCQWLSPVTQTKFTKVHFETRKLVLASLASFVKTAAFPPNLIIQSIEAE